MVGPRATVSIATSLQWSMRWDITALVQKNQMCAKKTIIPIGLNIFLCVNRGTKGKIFKTCFGLSE